MNLKVNRLLSQSFPTHVRSFCAAFLRAFGGPFLHLLVSKKASQDTHTTMTVEGA